MSRINMRDFIRHDNENPTPADPSGRGKYGQVKQGGILGRNIEIEVREKKITLNRGSLIDFINANKTEGTPDFEKHYFEYFDDASSNDTALIDKFNEVMRKIQKDGKDEPIDIATSNKSIPPFKGDPQGYTEALAKFKQLNTSEEYIKSRAPEASSDPMPTTPPVGFFARLEANDIHAVTAYEDAKKMLVAETNRPEATSHDLRVAGKAAETLKDKKLAFEFYLKSLSMDFDKSPINAKDSLVIVERLTYELGNEAVKELKEKVATELGKPENFFDTAREEVRKNFNDGDWYLAGINAEDRKDIENAFDAFAKAAEISGNQGNYSETKEYYDDAKRLATEHNIPDAENRLDKARTAYESVLNQTIAKGNMDTATSLEVNRAGSAAERRGDKVDALKFFLKSANMNKGQSYRGLANANRLADEIIKNGTRQDWINAKAVCEELGRDEEAKKFSAKIAESS